MTIYGDDDEVYQPWWTTLDDGELSDRLVRRGTPESDAEDWVRGRESPQGMDEISTILGYS